MSLPWAINRLAKNALLQAQKRIDAVLDIDDDEDEEEVEEEEDGLDEEETKKPESADGKGQNEEPYEDDTATESTSPNVLPPVGHTGAVNRFPDDWSSFLSTASRSSARAVVDAEPNPIRDSHEPPQLHSTHSPPSSVSPDEDESTEPSGSQASTGQRTPTVEAASHSLIAPVNTADRNMADLSGDMEDGNPRIPHDDERSVRSTLASSDIEVIKHMDDWSVTSSSNNHHSRVSVGDLTEVPLGSLLRESAADEQLKEQISLLQSKLNHRDRRIEELVRANENLKTTSTNLAAKNKQMSSTEMKLQKQLNEKQKELTDLMDEGKRLAEHSGKQSKEIRKLKSQLAQLDTLSTARDSAVKELQNVQQTLNLKTAEVDELQEALKHSEHALKQLEGEVEKMESSSGMAQSQIAEQFSQMDSLREENKRLERELKATEKRNQELTNENQQMGTRLLSKRAQDSVNSSREQGLMEELKVERVRGAQLSERVKELEERVESITDQQREATLYANESTVPLLATIGELERKLQQMERHNEVLFRQAQQRNDAELGEKRQLTETVSLLRSKLEEEKASHSMEVSAIKGEKHKLQSQLVELEGSIRVKEEKFMEKLKRAGERSAHAENELTSKNKECRELEEECSNLRRTLKEISEPSCTRGMPSASLASLSNHVVPTQAYSADGGGDEGVPKAIRQPLDHALRQEQVGSPTPLTFGQVASASRPVLVDMVLSPSASELEESQVSSTSAVENLRGELEDGQARFYQLREKFDRLLEMYGACLETIEELKFDNEDLRNLCKEQALKLAQ